MKNHIIKYFGLEEVYTSRKRSSFMEIIGYDDAPDNVKMFVLSFLICVIMILTFCINVIYGGVTV